MKRRNAARAAQVQTPMLFEEERRDVAELSQWFTHPKTAEVLHLWARLKPGARVLEPSCGDGALIRPRLDLDWTAVEIDQATAARCPVPTHVGDFLKMTPEELGAPFDAVVMNPPYEGGADLEHVLHAFEFAPVVVALVRSDFEHGVDRWERLWRWFAGRTWKLSFVRRPFKGAMSEFVVWKFISHDPWRSKPRGLECPVNVEQVWA